MARPEFEFASETMKILENAGMPYGVIPGNHDNVRGANHDLYNEFFGPARFDAAEETAAKGEDGEGYYGGSYLPEDNQNHFDLAEAGGQKLIVVYMGYVFGQEEIDWANQVLAQHADRKAIFATHEYLDAQSQPGRPPG